MNKSSKKILGTCSGILIVAAMIVAGYFLLNKQVQKEAQENDKHGNRASKSIAASVEDHVNHQGTWYFTCVSRTAAGQYIDQVKGLQRTGYRKDHTHTQNRLDHRNCDIT